MISCGHSTQFDTPCTSPAVLAIRVLGATAWAVVDPFGHAWGIATHVEDLSDEEIDRRGAEYFAGMGGG